MSLEYLFSRKKFKLKEGNLKWFIQKSNEKLAVDCPDGRVSPAGPWWLDSLGLPECHFCTEASFFSFDSKNFTEIEWCRAHPFFKQNMQASNTSGNVIYFINCHVTA